VIAGQAYHELDYTNLPTAAGRKISVAGSASGEGLPLL
jgi:hypothetical protein